MILPSGSSGVLLTMETWKTVHAIFQGRHGENQTPKIQIVWPTQRDRKSQSIKYCFVYLIRVKIEYCNNQRSHYFSP